MRAGLLLGGAHPPRGGGGRGGGRCSAAAAAEARLASHPPLLGGYGAADAPSRAPACACIEVCHLTGAAPGAFCWRDGAGLAPSHLASLTRPGRRQVEPGGAAGAAQGTTQCVALRTICSRALQHSGVRWNRRWECGAATMHAPPLPGRRGAALRRGAHRRAPALGIRRAPWQALHALFSGGIACLTSSCSCGAGSRHCACGVWRCICGGGAVGRRRPAEASGPGIPGGERRPPHLPP